MRKVGKDSKNSRNWPVVPVHFQTTRRMILHILVKETYGITKLYVPNIEKY